MGLFSAIPSAMVSGMRTSGNKVSKTFATELRNSRPVYGSGTANRYLNALQVGDLVASASLYAELVSLVGAGRAVLLVAAARAARS